MKVQKILSRFRKLYFARFFFRCAVFIATLVCYIVAPEQFDILPGFESLKHISVLHILWVIWMFDMVMQLVPSRKYWPLGSQKFLKNTFKPIVDRINREGLFEYVVKCNRDTLKIGCVWLALTLIIGALHFFTDFVDTGMLLVISVAFYVCDIICVLFWCPFRVWFMKNRCCTTCRIFNWDHMMMFSPIVFIPGVYTWTLCLAALVVFFSWEIAFALHPERFWDGSNEALRCSNCTDRLCGERNCQLELYDTGDSGS